MKQTTLNSSVADSSICSGRLVTLGLFFGLAMLLLWQLAGATPMGHALVWGVAILAGLKFWRAIEGG